MITIHTDDCSTFQIAPRDLGQTIEYAYATTEGGYVRRTANRSGPTTSYEFMAHDDCDDGDFAPQNGDVPKSDKWLPAAMVQS
ncbi:hypothetical protein LCGC14_0832500 [marine sediment metagenome]|uniref:Uncharacterized protein n=1 Tax=marine sediment metagenome TaxID=412755 RepID=A0A0F9S097_9ZZZZ